MSTRAVLCLGSNLEAEQARLVINAAKGLLKAGGCGIAADSGVYDTAGGYANEVLAADTDLPCQGLVALAKEIERSLGRSPEMKSSGHVPIDIDVVMFGGSIERPADFAAPYFTLGYSMLTH